MKLYARIDLHSNNSMLVIINEEDRVKFQKRLPNELERILLALASFKAWLVGVVVESTYNWYWLVDGLMQAGYAVHLAHPAALVQYQGLLLGGRAKRILHRCPIQDAPRPVRVVPTAT
jgi:transposase